MYRRFLEFVYAAAVSRSRSRSVSVRFIRSKFYYLSRPIVSAEIITPGGGGTLINYYIVTRNGVN